MVLLSIAINVWPNTDVYRFMLLLGTYLHRPSCIDDYFHIAEVLNGWKPRERSVPSDRFESLFIENHFERIIPSKPDELELILAMDGREEKPVIEPLFVEFCESISVHCQIIHNSKVGVASMRNLAMQTFRGEYLMFRDDDDFSACLEDLYLQALKLKELGLGTNGMDYWKSVMHHEWTDVYQLQRELWKYQRKPVIAMLMTNIRIKNTWGTTDNPFSIVPLPIDTTNARIVDRPSFLAMWSKVFSRESIPLISNSINLGSLEDSRSFYTQEWPQKSFYVFRDEAYSFYINGYHLYRKYINGKSLTSDEFDHVKRFCYRVNQNILPFKYDQISMNRKNPNMQMLEKLIPYFINVNVCSGAYVFPSGNYSRNSWTWASLIGVLEAYRSHHKSLEFTTLDLTRAHRFIETSLRTELMNIDCVCKVHALNDDPATVELARLFESIDNYKYIYWTAIVNRKQDWEWFAEKMKRIRELLNMIENKGFKMMNGADTIQEIARHPCESIDVEVIIDGRIDNRRLSLSNSTIVDDVDLLRSNYTDRFMKGDMKKELTGGNYENDPSPESIKEHLYIVITEPKREKFIVLKQFLILMLLITVMIVIIRFLMMKHGFDRSIEQQKLQSRSLP